MKNISTDETLAKQIQALIEDDLYMISSLSNVSAALWDAFSQINWVGFYLRKDDQLVLGPFHGKVACVIIEKGKGVCGAAFLNDQTQRVEDVHAFAGHIACDVQSRSEIVIPIHHHGEVVAVLDMDSPVVSRFKERDQELLEEIVKVLENNWKMLI